MKKHSKLDILWNGMVRDNPVLRLVLGTCSALAISVSVVGSFGMGFSVIFVLACSNVVISLLRNIIPGNVRIPCYITVVAGFVTIVQMLVHAYLPSLYQSLGIYLPLIVVNCIILGRAEMFASRNTPIDSLFDGIGMGIGYLGAVVMMASIREILGSGTWLGIRLLPEAFSIHIFTMAPGGFFTYGCVIALLTAMLARRGKKLLKTEGCGGNCAHCNLCADGKEEEEK